LNDDAIPPRPPSLRFANSVEDGEVVAGGNFITVTFSDEDGQRFTVAFPYATFARTLLGLQVFGSEAARQQIAAGTLPQVWPEGAVTPLVDRYQVYRDGQSAVLYMHTISAAGLGFPPAVVAVSADRATAQGMADALTEQCWELWQFERGRN